MADESSTSQRAAQVDEQTKQRSGCPTTHPEFDRLVRTIWRLRQPDGCPWDKEQTHRSLVKNMIEEAYEAVDAIEANDKAHLREELGDVLEQVLLHAQIEADATLSGVERKSFDIDDICRELNDKLIRRHPHVFHSNTASSSASTSDQVLEIWDEVKAEERKEKGMNSDAEPGLLDSVPTSLPALMQCQKISDRVAKVGFDWNSPEAAWDKVAEERAEYEAEEPGTPEATMELGDIFFALVNVARKQGIDAETALAKSNRKFRHRWSQVESMALSIYKTDVSHLTTQQLNYLWERVKGEETTSAR
jgi:tetrapyrrole methylase family protein/MazG family protein